MREDKVLSIFLWLVAIHSFFVGVGLVVLPTSAFEYFGFNPTFERFFSTQGGVFHIAMSVGYAMAGYNLAKYKQLIIFSIIVKFIATVFLLSYFLIVSSQWLILMSGISDFLMGIIILYLYLVLNRNLYFDQTQL